MLLRCVLSYVSKYWGYEWIWHPKIQFWLLKWILNYIIRVCYSLLQEHIKHAKFLKKRIEMYDELAIVVVKNMAIGNFAKSYNDLDTQ